MVKIIICVLFTLAGIFFLKRRTPRYLHILQLEEYHAERYLAWIREHRAWDSRASLVLLATALLGVVIGALFEVDWSGLFVLLGALGVVFVARSEPDPTREAKVTLKMSERAQQTLRVAFALGSLLLLCFVWVIFRIDAPVFALFIPGVSIAQLLPFLPVFAVRALGPFETRVQQGFVQDARELVQRVKPFTIGITGSFGKTSVKNMLGEVLNIALGPTFWPKQGVNTPMGITREIRERLLPGFRYAVVEMGAYGVGSIRRLCELTPPQAAIVTAVGTMHLERFGSAEAVYRAKSELPQAVPDDGILVLNGDNPGARRMAGDFRKGRTLLYGFDTSAGPLDCVGSNVRFSLDGSEFDVEFDGAKYTIQTKMLGAAALSNLLGTFTMACALGAAPGSVIAVIRNLEPVDNRLVLKRDGAITYLQDAYNSNPSGFRAALEVLQALPAERRILMTPGMIELGDTQYEENRKVAEFAAKVCTDVVVVAEVNRSAILEGLKAGGMSQEHIHPVPDRSSAFQCVRELAIPGSVILIENDLNDLYEGRLAF